MLPRTHQHDLSFAAARLPARTTLSARNGVIMPTCDTRKFGVPVPEGTMPDNSRVTLEVSVLPEACTIHEAFYFGHDGREILCLPFGGWNQKRFSPGQRCRVTGRWSSQHFTCFEADGVEAL